MVAIECRFDEAATFSTSEMNLAAGQDAWRVKVTESSANFFQLLGVNAGGRPDICAG